MLCSGTKANSPTLGSGIHPTRRLGWPPLARPRTSAHASGQGATLELITVALSATIGAPANRVWRALTDSVERVAWDERILGKVEPSGANEPATKTGKSRPVITQWRFRLGGIPLVMREELIVNEPTQRRVSHISIGSMRFDQTLTLHPEDDENGPRTRLSMKLVARNRIAVIGEVVERLDVQKIVIEYLDTTLRQVQKFCEADA